jgi:hypothetical protein
LFVRNEDFLKLAKKNRNKEIIAAPVIITRADQGNDPKVLTSYLNVSAIFLSL